MNANDEAYHVAFSLMSVHSQKEQNSSIFIGPSVQQQ